MSDTQKMFADNVSQNDDTKNKVTSLEIIVRMIDNKPYYEIKYKKVDEDYYQVGYSSYNLNNVLKWRDECFELVNVKTTNTDRIRKWMATKPILFNTEMVRAILDGRKSCTRRLIKTRRKDACGFYVTRRIDGSFAGIYEYDENESMFDNPLEPPYQPGDILYVRETFAWCPCWDCGMDTEQGACTDHIYHSEKKEYGCYMYRASCEDNEYPSADTWHPSIHMPKEAARIWLKVTDVRVERLQEIDEDGAWNEGFRFTTPCLTRISADGHTCDLDGPCTSPIKYCDMTMGELFGRELWNSTIKKSDLDRYGWNANPWVWVIKFERCEKPEGEN